MAGWNIYTDNFDFLDMDFDDAAERALNESASILEGTMSLVGTRPESLKYVEQYQPEYYATLLMPAGVTSEASIRYKKEGELFDITDNIDRVYVEQVLPEKMKWNLESIRRFRFLREIVTLFRTVFAVLGKDYNGVIDGPRKKPDTHAVFTD